MKDAASGWPFDGDSAGQRLFDTFQENGRSSKKEYYPSYHQSCGGFNAFVAGDWNW